MDCCAVVDLQTIRALSAASLFVFCHVMLHVFGTYYRFFNHLAQSKHLSLVSLVETVYGLHIKRVAIFFFLYFERKDSLQNSTVHDS